MDAAQALADLTAISSQIEGAVIAGTDGRVVAATFADAGRGEQVARAALDLLRAADDAAGGTRPVALLQLQAAQPDGSVFVVRDGERVVVAVTGAEPTAGLVFYDLKTCLRLAAAEGTETTESKKSRRTKKAAPAEADA